MAPRASGGVLSLFFERAGTAFADGDRGLPVGFRLPTCHAPVAADAALLFREGHVTSLLTVMDEPFFDLSLQRED